MGWDDIPFSFVSHPSTGNGCILYTGLRRAIPSKGEKADEGKIRPFINVVQECFTLAFGTDFCYTYLSWERLGFLIC